MPTGRVRDWNGRIGRIVDGNGVQYTFDHNELQSLQPGDIEAQMSVDFDAAKAGSSWQARNVRRVGEPSAGTRPRTAPVAPKRTDGFGSGIDGLAELVDLVPVAVPRELLTLVPLPSETRRAVEAVPVRDRHPGLQLDKLLTPVRDQEAQRQALLQVCAIPPGSPLFAEVRGRYRDLLEAVGARVWSRTTATPLTLHLSRPSVLDNAGICLHPIHGFVYLPGSTLRRQARAYAEQVWLPAHPDEAKVIEAVFDAGAVVFHEAWPEAWPRLVVDVANNHHADYYHGGGPPGDWQEPEPAYFLAVPPGASFTFALSLRQPDEPEGERLLVLAREWLDGALTWLGVGAKTSAGYGCFARPTTPVVPVSPGFEAFEATLTLATPAYLAGALQTQEDCDLRAATVRGLLRWWWRTLHSGFVDVPTLRRLESLLWGDTGAGSAIQVRVEPLPGPLRPVESPFLEADPSNQRLRFRRQFQREHGLWDAPEGRSQGLAYAAFGLDEGTPGERRRRWVAPAGMSWKLTLVARAREPLTAGEVLTQAKAALWWLTQLGGAGARSRKGFGSFSDPKELAGFEGGRWLTLGKEFRKRLGLSESEFNPSWAGSPAIHLMRELAKQLNLNPWLSVPTVWTDPWRALDEIGMAMQTFAQAAPDSGHGRHSDRKRHLGLPRQLHGPFQKRQPHQAAGTHRPPVPLKGVHGERHASPVFYHVAGTPGQKLTIRVAAFPTASLRHPKVDAATGLQECTQLHRELLELLSDYLRRRATEP